MRKGARDGDLTIRAACATAYRVRILRLAAGHVDEESEHAEAGALVDAEDATDSTAMRHMLKTWLEATPR